MTNQSPESAQCDRQQRFVPKEENMFTGLNEDTLKGILIEIKTLKRIGIMLNGTQSEKILASNYVKVEWKDGSSTFHLIHGYLPATKQLYWEQDMEASDCEWKASTHMTIKEIKNMVNEVRLLPYFTRVKMRWRGPEAFEVKF